MTTTAVSTDKKTYKLPDEALYTYTIAKVKKESRPNKFKGGEMQDTYLFVLELQGTDDGEGKPIPLFHRISATNTVKFTSKDEQGNTSTRETKSGKFLKTIIGELPLPLYFDKVDWEALVGTYGQVYVQHNESNGRTFANAGAFSPTKDATQKEFNETRKSLVLKQEAA